MRFYNFFEVVWCFRGFQGHPKDHTERPWILRANYIEQHFRQSNKQMALFGCIIGNLVFLPLAFPERIDNNYYYTLKHVPRSITWEYVISQTFPLRYLPDSISDLTKQLSNNIMWVSTFSTPPIGSLSFSHVCVCVFGSNFRIASLTELKNSDSIPHTQPILSKQYIFRDCSLLIILSQIGKNIFCFEPSPPRCSNLSGIGGKGRSWDTGANMGIELSGIGGRRGVMGY